MILPNVDTLFLNLDFEAYDTQFADLHEELQRKKDIAKEQMEQYSSHGAYIDINGLRFQVLPNGIRSFAYVLHGELLELNISRYRSGKKEIYPVRVRFKSEFLWSSGLHGAWDFFKSWIEQIAPIYASQVSRVDMCCHTDEFNFSENVQEHFKGDYVKDQLFREHRVISGYSFGSRDAKIYVRVYNKALEIQKSKKEWFHEVWKANGATGEDVWNVEFQLVREFLRESSIETMEDLLSNLRSIWLYLTEQHIVLTEKDRTRVERSSISAFWLRLTQAWESFDGNARIERKKILGTEADALVPQMAGVITSYISRLGLGIFEMADINQAIHYIIPKYYKEKKNKPLDRILAEKYALLQEVCGNDPIFCP